MDIHQNARLVPKMRGLLARKILEGQPVRAVALEFHVTEKTARKWLKRYKAEGEAGMEDRSSRPLSSPSKTSVALKDKVAQLRRQRSNGIQIAQLTRLSRSTVFRILGRLGINRLGMLDTAPPAERYEHDAPRDLLHLDIKRLGRFSQPGHRVTGDRQRKTPFAGWEFLHVVIDDHSRVAFSDLFADQRAESAISFLKTVVARYRVFGVTSRRLLTDNGSCYRSYAWRDACLELGITHKRTRPYRPQTNGKCERFHRTLADGWAYARFYSSETERREALPGWLHFYNHHRIHSAIGGTPASRLNNLPGHHS